jgi:hypothetical protein
MPTITQQNALIQKKALAADPSISFGNLQYNNPGVKVAGQSPGGFSMSATMFPSQTDSTGKQDPKAVQFANNITQGLQQQQYGDTANDTVWDSLQKTIGSMGVGPGYGGGTYVPYTQQQLDYEKQENAQNQAYGQQYMDYLTGKNTNTSAADKAKLYQAAVESAQKDPNWGVYDANDQQAAISTIYNGMLAAYNSGGGDSGSGASAPDPSAPSSGSASPPATDPPAAGAAAKPGMPGSQANQTKIQGELDKGTSLNAILQEIASTPGATPDWIQTWQTWATKYSQQKNPPAPSTAPASQGAGQPPASVQAAQQAYMTQQATNPTGALSPLEQWQDANTPPFYAPILQYLQSIRSQPGV